MPLWAAARVKSATRPRNRRADEAPNHQAQDSAVRHSCMLFGCNFQLGRSQGACVPTCSVERWRMGGGTTLQPTPLACLSAAHLLLIPR